MWINCWFTYLCLDIMLVYLFVCTNAVGLLKCNNNVGLLFSVNIILFHLYVCEFNVDSLICVGLVICL